MTASTRSVTARDEGYTQSARRGINAEHPPRAPAVQMITEGAESACPRLEWHAHPPRKDVSMPPDYMPTNIGGHGTRRHRLLAETGSYDSRRSDVAAFAFQLDRHEALAGHLHLGEPVAD